MRGAIVRFDDDDDDYYCYNNDVNAVSWLEIEAVTTPFDFDSTAFYSHSTAIRPRYDHSTII